ncbi:hypothetical protein K3495_g8124 [Podosphaera aphanis]|nr:hypothetical protein K3495_g8124 [Podosphaera aphanis]
MYFHPLLLALACFWLSFTAAVPVPGWGEYKLNAQYPPWPSRPCADFGATACYRAEGRKGLLSHKAIMVCDPGTEMWLPCPGCVRRQEVMNC